MTPALKLMREGDVPQLIFLCERALAEVERSNRSAAAPALRGQLETLLAEHHKGAL